MRGVQAEEDAAALASEGQGTSAIAGLEAGLQNLQMGMLGGIGSSYNSGAAPRVPSSGALDAHGESPIQSDTPAHACRSCTTACLESTALPTLLCCTSLHTLQSSSLGHLCNVSETGSAQGHWAMGCCQSQDSMDLPAAFMIYPLAGGQLCTALTSV